VSGLLWGGRAVAIFIFLSEGRKKLKFYLGGRKKFSLANFGLSESQCDLQEWIFCAEHSLLGRITFPPL
jgi:hypothetical protein